MPEGQRGPAGPLIPLSNEGNGTGLTVAFGCFLLWQGVGNLNNGANAGLGYVNGNNALSNANWNIASRQSD